jgi:hypothetical protein
MGLPTQPYLGTLGIMPGYHVLPSHMRTAPVPRLLNTTMAQCRHHGVHAVPTVVMQCMLCPLARYKPKALLSHFQQHRHVPHGALALPTVHKCFAEATFHPNIHTLTRHAQCHGKQHCRSTGTSATVASQPETVGYCDGLRMLKTGPTMIMVL